MTTKAEWFAYFSERSHPRVPKKAKAGHTTPRDATEKAPRSESKKLTKKATYALEESAGRASRKSTRKAANRIKTDSQMRSKRRQAEVAPQRRGPK